MNTLAEWVEWIEGRAKRDGDCLVWMGAFNRGTTPQTCFDTEDGKKKSILIRRKLWEMKKGRPPRQNYVVLCKCDTFGCVEPDHLKEVSRSQMLRGRETSPEHRLALTKAARARKNNKLDQAAVNDIRYGDGTVEEKAAKYGITLEYAEDVINHRCWKDLSNPFVGLMA